MTTHAKRQVLCIDCWTTPPSSPNSNEQTAHTRECICTPCSDCVADMYVDLNRTCEIYTPACTGAQDTCLVYTSLTAKMHIHPRKHARATVQQSLRHENACNTSSNWALPKKLPESTPAHGVEKVVLSHRHHMIIRLVAGPILFVHPSHSPLAATEIILNNILFRGIPMCIWYLALPFPRSVSIPLSFSSSIPLSVPVPL